MKKLFIIALLTGLCAFGQSTNRVPNRITITPQQAQDAIPVANAQIAEIDARYAIATAQHNQQRTVAVRQRDQLISIASQTNAPTVNPQPASATRQ